MISEGDGCRLGPNPRDLKSRGGVAMVEPEAVAAEGVGTGVESNRARDQGQSAHSAALSRDRRLAARQEAQAPEAPGRSRELAT
jgi:hypothetical protein